VEDGSISGLETKKAPELTFGAEGRLKNKSLSRGQTTRNEHKASIPRETKSTCRGHGGEKNSFEGYNLKTTSWPQARKEGGEESLENNQSLYEEEQKNASDVAAGKGSFEGTRGGDLLGKDAVLLGPWGRFKNIQRLTWLEWRNINA